MMYVDAACWHCGTPIVWAEGLRRLCFDCFGRVERGERLEPRRDYSRGFTMAERAAVREAEGIVNARV